MEEITLSLRLITTAPGLLIGQSLNRRCRSALIDKVQVVIFITALAANGWVRTRPNDPSRPFLAGTIVDLAVVGGCDVRPLLRSSHSAAQTLSSCRVLALQSSAQRLSWVIISHQPAREVETWQLCRSFFFLFSFFLSGQVSWNVGQHVRVAYLLRYKQRNICISQ